MKVKERDTVKPQMAIKYKNRHRHIAQILGRRLEKTILLSTEILHKG